MKPAPFEYHAPETVDEVLHLLSQHGDEARVLAGGQTLVPMLALRVTSPGHLVDINGVAGLDHAQTDPHTISIPALCRHASLEHTTAAGSVDALLARAASAIAHLPIRLRGTVCGSLAHADPASEWCAVACALDAELTLASRRGHRRVTAGDYFLDLMTTAREDDELLLEARLPRLTDDTRLGFYEFSRRAGDFALGLCVAGFSLRDGRMQTPRIALGGIEPTPRRIAEGEAVLLDQPPGQAVFEAAGHAVAAAVDPLIDHQHDEGYRRALARTVVQRALADASQGGD